MSLPSFFFPPLPPLPRRACELRAAAASRQVALAAAKFARLWVLDWTLVRLDSRRPLEVPPPPAAPAPRSPILRDARAAAAQPQPHLGAEHERVARSGGPRARTPQVCLCAAPSDRRAAAAVRAAVRRGPRPAAATAVSHEGSVGTCAREAGRIRDAARGEAQARAGAAARRSRGPLQRAGGGAVPAAAQPQGAHEPTRTRTVTPTPTLTATPTSTLTLTLTLT